MTTEKAQTSDSGASRRARLGRWVRRRPLRAALLAFLAVATCVILVVVAINLWIVVAARPYLYDSTERIPSNEVAVLLGTTSRSIGGGMNAYFASRIDAAADLYRAGKVRHILASGSNPTSHYNEPLDMLKALSKRGVPPGDVTLDYAGFRTLDSVVRAREVFGLRRFTIVSQRYHNYRAVFLARHYGMEAVAYDAEDVGDPVWGRYYLREVLARVKAVLDLYVLHTPPKYLGDAVAIPLHRPGDARPEEATP